jgi:putative DNA primase/helicase
VPDRQENEAHSWCELQVWALEQRRAGRSVLFFHHAGKDGDQRGTSRREDVMDTVMKLSLPSDDQASEGARFIVEFTKARGIFGDDAEAFEASLKDGTWTDRAATCARDEQIAGLKAERLSQREIAQEVGCGLATVNCVLKRAGDD